MDKLDALKTLQSSAYLTLHHDIGVDLATITVRGVREPILLIEQSELVGWIRIEGPNAVWR
ncbi:hypothetical protein QE394_000995 [Arthrobacter sp. SORGH_AS 212]|uniref:hypothetical protein n=1 Tax=Pseudarthrobacter sp. SORGH_AS 212 TaxID=3041777 RepID=UPI002783F6B5|nr:hypothetical protein [Arthrobacter sp. SORGH_AS_0212]